MDITFENKRILVTGAASGIGKGIALRLLRCGGIVIALDRSQENLEILKQENPSIEIVAVNLACWEETHNSVSKILPIDMLVNCAGLVEVIPITDVKEDIYQTVTAAHWEIIISFMEKHPDLAKGFINCSSGKDTARKLWEELTTILNAAGLGDRTTKKWQKCSFENTTLQTTLPNPSVYENSFIEMSNSVDFVQCTATPKEIDSSSHTQVIYLNEEINDSSHKKVASSNEEQAERLFDVNVKGLISVTQAVVADLLKRESPGSIVNISSQASQAALLNHTIYCASKGAVDAFTRALALELGPKNIRINCVNPTVVMTELGRKAWSDPTSRYAMLAKIPLQRFAEINDVADAVLFLLSDKASMINGHCLPVDGGFLAT